MRRKIHVEPSRRPSSISPARWGPDTFEGMVLETRLTLVVAVLVTGLLTWGCATTMSVATPTAAEELAGIKARLAEVVFRQRTLELQLAAIGEACPRYSDLNNALRSDVAALEPVLAHIESDLVAFQTKYPQHPESRGAWTGVDSTRKLIRALLAGATLPSMTVAEPPVICPGTSQWNGRGCTTKPLAGALAALAPPVLAQDAYVDVQGQVRKPGAIKYTSGRFNCMASQVLRCYADPRTPGSNSS